MQEGKITLYQEILKFEKEHPEFKHFSPTLIVVVRRCLLRRGVLEPGGALGVYEAHNHVFIDGCSNCKKNFEIKKDYIESFGCSAMSNLPLGFII